MSVMSKLQETEPVGNPSSSVSSHRPAHKNSPDGCPTVVILAPPWPRSGTARVIQNQTAYYRQRGFHSLLVVVPFHWAYLQNRAIWNELNEGIHDFGADELFVATLEARRYKAAKYISSFRHAFRGTSLDWMIDLGRSSRLPENVIGSIHAARPVLLHVNHVYTLGFGLQLRQKLTGSSGPMPIILDTHDIQSHLLLEKGDVNPWTKRPDTLERLVLTEIAIMQNVDVFMHLSVDDIRFFKAHLPDKPHILSMPTIDETFIERVNGTPPPAEAIDLLFVGQSHAPNLAALKWFFAEVWPRIAARKYTLKVLGAVALFIQEFLPKVYEEFRPCFVGEVADLAPYYRAARCVIAPMVSGSGTSIKTIEALALGKPFIGTTKAYRGMAIEKIAETGIRAYDDPQSFADAIAFALANEVEVGAKSRIAYDRLFSRNAAFATRDAAIELLRKSQRLEV
jgi:glycosyltransferase involved in cell wall biosynthesis